MGGGADSDLREEAQESRVKLNLGCGKRIWPGYQNLDDRDGVDIRKLDYADNSADEIQVIHVLEHLYPWDVPGTLKEWYRVLKPGGLLIIELPCFEKVIQYCMNPNETSPYMTKFALYGGEMMQTKDPRDMHKWCYGAQEMVDILADAGFVDISRETALFHVPERDMRVLATKR